MGRGKGKKKLAAILALTFLPVFASAGSMALAADSGGFVDNGDYYGTLSSPELKETTTTGATVKVDDSSSSYSNVYGGYVLSENPGNVSVGGEGQGNNVTIEAGTISQGVYGGYAFIEGGEEGNLNVSATATYNEVTVTGGSVGDVVGGYSYAKTRTEGEEATSSATSSNNKVTIEEGATISGSIYGGKAWSELETEGASEDFSSTAYANNNEVEIKGGTIDGSVYGGYAQPAESAEGTATNNTVTISGGTIRGKVYGGVVTSGNGDAFKGNKLVVSSTDAIKDSVYNFETIEFGAQNTQGQNKYTFNVSLDNPGTEDTYTTTLSVSSTDANFQLAGDITDGSSATLGIKKAGVGTLALAGNNTYSGTTTISAGTLEIVEDSAFSNGDYVIESGAILKLNVADEEDLPVGYFTNDVSGAGTLQVEITNATMVLSGDLSGHTGTTKVTIPEDYSSAILRLASQQSVSGGSYVLDSGSTLELAFEGSFGQAISGEENTALSIDSTGEVVLTNAQTGFSGDTVVKSGTLRLENALAAGTSQNAISMAGGTSLVLAYAGEFSRGVSTTGASVNLVVDAAAKSGTDATADPGTDAATNPTTALMAAATTFSASTPMSLVANVLTDNTATNAAADTLYLTAPMDDYDGMITVLSGNLVAGENALASTTGLTLYGGASFTPASTYSLAGKVLNVQTSETGESAIFYGNLDASGATINYEGQLDSESPMLVVNGDANISNSVYSVKLVGENGFTPGVDVQLLSVTGDLVADNVTAASLSFGVSLESQAEISVQEVIDGDGTMRIVVLNYAEPTAKSESKALLEGSLAAATLVSQGADMVAGRGIEAARAARKDSPSHSVAPFAAVQGGSMRYNSGSHIDTQSLNLMAGLAVGSNTSAGEFTFGAFFEYGTGFYSTHNSFSSGSLDGNGNSHYVGWGLLARWDCLDTGPGHFYVEASGRMGGLYNSYENDDLSARFDARSDYDRYSAYYGFHAGLGYIFDFTEKAHLDVYGKYFWTRVNGESVTIATETIGFEDFTSSRLRFGSRFSYDVNEKVKPYIGAAWEHEFDGKARGSAWVNGYGDDISSPSLKGDTGIGEIGISLTPSEDVPFTLDIAVQGYVGKREGATGSILFKYAF